MAATYPHPVPKQNLVVIARPTGPQISQMPSLGGLVGSVAQWMTDNLMTARSWVNITLPGAVMVLADGEEDTPYPGMGRATVLNATMHNADISSLHQTWLVEHALALSTHRSPKMKGLKGDDIKYFYAENAVITPNAQPPDLGGSNNAWTDKVSKRIFINGHVDDGSILVHEYFHTFDPGDPSEIGWGMDEGIVDFFSRDLAAKYGYGYTGNAGYEGGYQAAKAIVDRIGLEKICQFWSDRSGDIFATLSAKTKALAEHCKPCEPSTVTESMIEDFCNAAARLTGWKALPVPVVAASSAKTPAKKWLTVEPVGNVFRTHG